MIATRLPDTEAPVLRPHRWTRTEFDHMVLAGIFEPDARIELIEGEILDMGQQIRIRSSHVVTTDGSRGF